MVSIRTLFVSAAFAAVGTFGGASLPSALSSGVALAANPYTCMTDDGYGRKRPCSAQYKAANPNWRSGDSCFTDDGYGRYRPCSAGFKAKQVKQSKEPAAK
jgi:hypothetical protein